MLEKLDDLSDLKEGFFCCKIKLQGDDNVQSKQTKKFEIENKDYQFDFQTFERCVKQYAYNNSIRPTKVLELMAEFTNVTLSATKQWYYQKNGPSDITIIQKVAEFLGVTDYMLLMKETMERTDMINLNSLQYASVKRIYDSIIDFLNDFYNTDGFTGELWYKFVREGSSDPEDDIYDYAINKIKEVNVVLQKEYFYLRNTSLYTELSEYVDNDLYDIFDGKLGYAYRFEAIPDGNPTTEDDYNKALKRLNEIIETYIVC